MFFPIGDTQVRGGSKAIISYGFIGLNIIIFILQIMTEGNLVCEYAVIPNDISNGQNLYTLITSMFLHGGWMHIIGNMLFLWVFADNIEAITGSLVFLIFYILGGLFASLAHIIMDGGITSAANLVDCCKPCMGCAMEQQKACPGFIPSLGASGAISAVMGAYLVMFPKSKIKIIFLLFFSTFYLSAWLFLCLWFGQQLISGMGNIGDIKSSATSGVAWWAHIGGFVFGLIAGFYFRRKYLTDSSEKQVYV